MTSLLASSKSVANMKPYVDAEFEASVIECDARKKILSIITPEQNILAWEQVKNHYAEFKSNCDAVAQSLLPMEPSSKFAVEIYYQILKDMASQAPQNRSAVLERTTLTDENVAAEITGFIEDSSADDIPSSGLDALLSGGSLDVSAAFDEEYKFMSSREILECSNQSQRCNFEGMIVVCDMEPRKIEPSNPSNDTPRRRKNQSTESKCADVLFIDKTGPISAALWNELADEICAI